MDRRGRNSAMLIPTAIMGALAIVLLLVGYRKGQGLHIVGMRAALNMAIQTLPLLVFAFIVAGMAQAILPKDQLSKWVGAESGLRGILIGTAAGGLVTGGPYVSLPIAAGLLRAGASVGTTVAFITGWSLWAVSQWPMQVGFLGWRFTVIRLVSTFFFPPIAGLIAQALSAGGR